MQDTQNTEEKLWFSKKMHGWGWVPVSVEGWAAVLIYLALLVADFMFIYQSKNSLNSTLVSFSSRFIFLSVVLAVVCYSKGGKTENSQTGSGDMPILTMGKQSGTKIHIEGIIKNY